MMPTMLYTSHSAPLSPILANEYNTIAIQHEDSGVGEQKPSGGMQTQC
jgi:hypothetical protein